MDKVETKKYINYYAPDSFVAWNILWDRLPVSIDRMKLSRYFSDNWLMNSPWVTLFALNERGRYNGFEFRHSPNYNV